MRQSVYFVVFLRLLLLLTLFSMSACGFHPRGQLSAPDAQLSPIFVSGLPSHHPFYRELAHQLQLSGLRQVKEQQAANTLLKIHKQKTKRRVLSVDSRNKTVEYEIEESLEYSIQHPQGNIRGKEHQHLSVSRILFNPDTQILGRDREEILLRTDMYKQLTRLLLKQLAAVR